MSKKKNGKTSAECKKSDEQSPYMSPDKCEICEEKIPVGKTFYEIGYVEICSICAKILSRAGRIKLAEFEPPAEPLDISKLFLNLPEIEAPIIPRISLSGNITNLRVFRVKV